MNFIHEAQRHVGCLIHIHPFTKHPHQVVDLRCVRTTDNEDGMNEMNLSYIGYYIRLIAELIEAAIQYGIELPECN